MSLETEIVEQLKAEFIAPENVPENVFRRDEMLQIAKASFAILFNSDKLVSFLGAACNQNEGKRTCKMPINSMEFQYYYNQMEYRFSIHNLYLNPQPRLCNSNFFSDNVPVQPWILNITKSITQNLCLDAGYAGKAEVASRHGMSPHIRPRGEEKKAIELQGFRPKRWIVEVAHSWFNRFRKVHVRYEKMVCSYNGLLYVAATMITMNKIMKIYPKL